MWLFSTKVNRTDVQFNHTLLNKLYICFSDQEERTKAIEAFKEEKKDVLVATDVASKGLDFPAIQHVVNYDMPEEIENYGRFSDDCFLALLVCIHYRSNVWGQ